ncbi:MAG: hypothetical protein ABT03_04120 [Comamonas sp. SCN 67-35]|jgi:hypothetical protein|uniref:hypothetical protein n=1 Tax=unclassified Comamonas TaxID=2638500 RepID=UPI000868BA96|nr:MULTISPECIES: hypothetical protein [unclassified Comamonas]MBN9330370.1 hypothetical protein [Comamonas sp.]MCD6662850.1 hypothetical protein [Comamonas sp.]ODU39329.1 MAG: hypothetical protein ABT03_04120 [Comamonas sp. SCN 67-35]OJW96600.1 MAG: hypothetical protein BGO73_04810 [Burkholderiales bacterium 66-26]
MPARLLSAVAQAIGFIAGALAGYMLARWLGVDLVHHAYGPRSVLAVAAVGLGGGIGIAAGRHWCVQRGITAPPKD